MHPCPSEGSPARTHTHTNHTRTRARTHTRIARTHIAHARTHACPHTHVHTCDCEKNSGVSESPREARHSARRHSTSRNSRSASSSTSPPARSFSGRSPRGLHEKTSAHHHAVKKQDWDSDDRSGHSQQRGGTFENLSPVSVFSTATQSVGLFASPSACPLETQMRCVFRSTVSSTGFGAKALAAPAGAEGTPSHLLCPLVVTCRWKGRASYTFSLCIPPPIRVIRAL